MPDRKPYLSLLRSLLPLFALAILVAAALVWQNYDGDSRSSQSCAEMVGEWGGPYPKEGGIDPSKINDFTNYPAPIRSLSQTKELTKLVLIASINGNLAAPYAARYQLYNYVVTTDCDFFIATWKGSSDFSLFSSNTMICDRDARRIAAGNTNGKMINIFPEDLGKKFRKSVDNNNRRSPCWLDIGEGKGILDALSKHFMLVQGVNKSIADFPAPDSSGYTPWADKRVAYAGELLVDLATCSYELNAGSGTYRPLAKNLKSVTRLFASQINGGSLKISGVESWC